LANLGATLVLIARALNSALRNAVPQKEDWVRLINLTDHDGSVVDESKDKIVMFLANLKHETVISTYNPNLRQASGAYATVAPPLYINMYVLFFANFQRQRYVQGLEMISRTIAFFQQRQVFTPQTLPGLDPSIDKLQFEFHNLDITDLNYLMALAGTKYLPSAYYKVRTVPFNSDGILAEVPPVQAPG